MYFPDTSGRRNALEDILESTKGVVTLMKNTWGYVPIHIETEGRFLKVSRQEILQKTL